MKVAFLSSHPYCRELADGVRSNAIQAEVVSSPLGLDRKDPFDLLVIDHEFLNIDVREELPQFGVSSDIPLIAFHPTSEISRHAKHIFANIDITSVITLASDASAVAKQLEDVGIGAQEADLLRSQKLTQRLTKIIKKPTGNEKKEIALESERPTFGHELLLQISRELLRQVPNMEVILGLLGIDFFVDRVRVFRFDEVERNFRVSAAWAAEPESLLNLTNYYRESDILPITKPLRAGRVVNITDIKESEYDQDLIDMLARMNLRSFLAAPIKSNRGELIGVLALGASQCVSYSESEEKLVGLVAEMLARHFQRLESEASLRLTHFSIDRASDAMIWTRSNGEIEYANHAASRLYGMTLPQILAKRLWELGGTTIGDRRSFETWWEQVMESRSIVNLGYALHRNGNEIPVETTTNSLSVNDQEFACSVIRDISKRQADEAQIAHNLALQTTLSEISRLLMRLNKEHEIATAVRLGEAFGAHRVIISWEVGPSDDCCSQWVDPAHAERAKFHPLCEIDHFSWLRWRMELGNPFGFKSISELKESAEAEHQFFSASGTHTMVAAPIFDSESRRIGAIGIEYMDREHSVTTAERDALSVVASILGTAWQQRADRQSLELQSKLIDQINDAIFVLDTQGVISSWNRGAQAIFGLSSVEAIGQHLSLLFEEEYHASLFEDVIRPILTKGGHEIETRCRTKVGRLFDAHFSLALLREGEGKPSGVICYASDISSRKRAEEHLLASQTRLASIVNSVRDAIVTCDSKGTILTLSASALKLFGEPDASVLEGAHLSAIISSNDAAHICEAISDHDLYDRTNALADIFKVRAKNGSLDRFPAEVFIVAGEVKEGRFYTLSIRDITDEVENAKRLAQGQRMQTLGALATGITHDLNNLLGPISAYAELLCAKPLNAEMKGNVSSILECAEKAKALTTQILAFSKRSSEDNANVSAPNFIKGLARLFHAAFGQEPDTQALALDNLEVDGRRVAAWQELAVRAAQAFEGLKSARVGVTLKLDGSLEGDQLCIRFSATPIIQDPMDRALFESSLDISSADKREIEAAAKALETHLVFEGHQAEEAMFTLRLPVADGLAEVKTQDSVQVSQEMQSPKSKASTRKYSTTGGVRVLVVDDDEMVGEAMGDLTKALGYEVEVYVNPKEAFERLKSAPDEFSIVISDFSMPEITGGAFTSMVESLGAEVGVIITTGVRDLVPDDIRANQCFLECLQKPISLFELEETLGRHCGPPNADQSVV